MTVSLAVSSSTAPVSTTLPLVHHHDVSAGVLDLRQEMRGDDDRTASGGVVSQHSAHRLDLWWVEAVGRLIQYEKGRQSEHGLGDAKSLQHPMAVPAYLAVDRRTKSGDLQRLVQVSLLQWTTGRMPVPHQVRHDR